MDDRFRVWDAELKEWRADFYIYSDGTLCYQEWDSVCEAKGGRYLKVASTGQKDKNGKLVFEGDIISIDPESPALAIIEYVAPSWCHHYLKWDETLPLPLLDKLTLKYSHVVGNIHEDPELLDKTK